MRRAFLVGAALVVLVANGWGVWQAYRNRTEARGGTLLLTEREVPPQPIGFESSVTVLRLKWRTDRGYAERHRPPAWLDTNKIAELGFDCSLPLNDPRAPRHYRSQPARRVFLVLEYQTDTSYQPEKGGQGNTGLVVVDASLDPQRLRERYPDPRKHVVCRGLVRLAFRRRGQDGALAGTPLLEARIESLCPPELSVPKPTNRLLATLQRAAAEEKNRPGGGPRFSARVYWGRNYEPWVDDLRALNK